MKSLTARLLAVLPWSKRHAPPLVQASNAPEPEAPKPPAIAGSGHGWLRVLTAQELLAIVHGQRVIDKIYAQSRVSEIVFQRDFVPAIHAYAEFVQLMPASEAHHHAHVGGLLTHTLEMVLAAMTWRNGHLLPEGEVIEVIDAQRDHWTYVVFLAALLHDVAKPMTDLRISWRSKTMEEALRWAPVAGSLCQVTQGRAQAEYLVEFTPKAARDYSAHSRLAQLLLPRIAPPSALAFLSIQPGALNALEQYLTGADRTSLVAQIVKRADSRSAQRALANGSQARFATAKAVPLIDLLMQAIGAMLRAGTSLPLNRSGAAGWVHDGAIWFVAKRLADAVREWIQKNEPDQTVPGETKNDRLFDTWQDYGVIERNPHTGQAVWYVTVEGDAGGAEQGAYRHQLTMLKFPLAKVFAGPEQYPQSMEGTIVVRETREVDASVVHEQKHDAASNEQRTDADAGHEPDESDAGNRPNAQEADAALTAAGSISAKPTSKTPAKPAIKEPAFQKSVTVKAPGFKKPAGKGKPAKLPAQAPEPGLQEASLPAESKARKPLIDAEEAAYLLDEDASALEDLAELANKQPARPAAMRDTRREAVPGKNSQKLPQPAYSSTPVAATQANPPEAASARSNAQHTASMLQLPELPRLKPMARGPLPRIALVATHDQPPIQARSAPDAGISMEQSAPPEPAQPGTLPEPVLLRPHLPSLPGTSANAVPEPSELALDFMRWIQQSLVDRALKYNETGAAVHFVPEGMAVVSPLIFKQYAGTLTTELCQIPETAKQIQREVIKAGWHLPGPNKTNIVRYAVMRGEAQVSQLSVVVFLQPERWVQPVPPSNPVLVKM